MASSTKINTKTSEKQPPHTMISAVNKMITINEGLPLEIQLQEAQRRRKSVLEHLEPLKQRISEPLKRFLATSLHTLDINKVNPQARIKLQKYIFLTRSNTALETLENTIVSKMKSSKQINKTNVVSMKRKAENQDVTTPTDCDKDIAQSSATSNKQIAKVIQPKKRAFTQEVMLECLKISSQGQVYLLKMLPRDLVGEILSHLSFKDLMTLCQVDKFCYNVAGNETRWQELCAHLSLSEPNQLLNQTFKNVYAMSRVGRNKCQKCGKRTSRKLATWHLTVCKRCQGTIVVTKTQAKRCYMLKEDQLKNLSTHETPGTDARPPTVLFLKHQVEQAAMQIWKGIPAIEKECMKRIQRRSTLQKKNEELVEEIEKMIDSDDSDVNNENCNPNQQQEQQIEQR